MADETKQAEEETSWWLFDAFADSELPSTPFDEPLQWPDALDWGDVGGDDAELRFPGTFDFGSADPLQPISPTTAAAAPQAPVAPPAPGATGDAGEETRAVVTPLAGLGGAIATAAPPGDGAVHEHLPDSLWADDAPAGAAGAPFATTVFPTTPDAGGWRRRFDLRHGNAAIIALISFASLVLLGMFLSVRARNDVPTTDISQTRTTTDQIAVQGTLNTVPLTIPTTIAGAPPATINIADLVPSSETTAGGSGGTTATTAAPARTTPTSASTATTQPTNTTAVTAPATTTPTSAAPQPDDTTQTTRRTTTSSIVFPTLPTNPNFPSIPTIPRRD